MTTKSVEI